MAHYYTKEECEAKTAELNELQRDPNYDIALTLKKDANGGICAVARTGPKTR